MGAAQVQHYLDRARDFLEGMNLLKDDLEEFGYSSALLGIHCAISYCDALRTGLGCGDVSSDDHRNAAGDLQSRLATRKFEKLHGTNHLERLVSKKSRIEYGSHAAAEHEIEDIVKRAGRFASWAEETGRDLKIGGW